MQNPLILLTLHIFLLQSGCNSLLGKGSKGETMRTDSFSKEKHLPVRRFIADESKVATGFYGPRAIADDLDNLFNMFDPDALFLDGFEQGGISEKNLQNGAVSYEKLGDDVKSKFQGVATEQQLLQIQAELLQKTNAKADKATTLAGYGILDAYSVTEIDGWFEELGEEWEAKLSKKSEENILYEDVVSAPEWKNQPTVVSGDVASVFNTNDFYYVTLKDATGNALPAGQFRLKDFYTEGATVFSTIFTLENLNTGYATLVENYPVEFTSVGINIKLRDAGVWEVTYKPSDWKLNGNQGKIRFVCDGEWVQRASGSYFVLMGISDKKVAHYHSVESTAFQSDSTTQIVPYVPLSGISSYKINKFYDELMIERLSDTRYITKRNTTLRCMAYGGNSYKVISQNVIGHGELFDTSTYLTSFGIQSSVKADRGFLRNGSVIRVTEVK